MIRFGKIMILLTMVIGLVCMLLSDDDDSRAGPWEERRVWLGLDLFPSLLAADLDITAKAGAEGQLLLLIVHTNAPRMAAELARHLTRIHTIRGIPIRVATITTIEFEMYRDDVIAGLFICQRLDSQLKTIVAYGREKGVITFSPFEHDVEQGVLGGILITHRIVPYINRTTMVASGIRIKDFFLRVAAIHEDH